MFWLLEPLTGPAIEPVTLAEMRLHLQEFDDVTANDVEYTALITEGRRWVENYTGRALIDQRWRLTVGDVYRESLPLAADPTRSLSGSFDARRTSGLVLRRSPVLAIESFHSVDSAGDETEITTGFELREAASKWPRLAALSGATWPSASGVDLRVVFRAGYADQTGSPQTGAEVVPALFKRAIKLYASAMYERDKNTMERFLDAAKSILKHERCHVGFA